MYGKKVKLRILFISLLLISIILSIFLILKSLEENVVYFFSPTEIKSITEISNKKIRIGGMVKDNSIVIESENIKIGKLDFKESKYSTGKRKTSIARIWLKKGTGQIYVNGRKMDDYFKRPKHQLIVSRPLSVMKKENEIKTSKKSV